MYLLEHLCSAVRLLFAFLFLSAESAEEHEQQHYADPEICGRILDCDGINIGDHNLISSFESRALPNKRLVEAFGINNAFTSSDEAFCKAFRTGAAQKISRLGDDKWRHISKFAQTLVSRHVDMAEGSLGRIPLTPLVQSLSMAISLYVLFDRDPLEQDGGALSDLASSINKLWMYSKSRNPNCTQIAFWQCKQSKALSKLFHREYFKPNETPMNFIIPAYETLWRVVLRCFLEVTFRDQTETRAWQHALSLYLAEPTIHQFRSPTQEADVAPVSFIVNEALRLYPPTRRVYRTFQLNSKSKARRTVAADIERCQRDSTIWGLQSSEFQPKRWKDPSADALKTFRPFGGRRFTCPAGRDFGPRMIGVLVAALTESIRGDSWKLVGHISFKASEPLDSDRQAYDQLQVGHAPY